ncbi:serine protease [Glaciimonas sp. PCH181]|uniref:S1 family peptidase n=1 Tax=Glaciimonas sp. PCH181 TaxID=2133943 RepID=UPI0013749D09|nr:serine protease [Glaciimonas sp. PCH181]
MQKFMIKHAGLVPLILLSLATTAAHANAKTITPTSSDSSIQYPIQKATKVAYAKDILNRGAETTTVEIRTTGSQWSKLYFSKIALPKGAYIEISNPERTEVSLYGWRDFMRTYPNGSQRTFSPTSISGDTTVIQIVYPQGVTPGDRDSVYLAYYEIKQGDKLKTILGQDERIHAICMKSTNNAFYQRSQAIGLASMEASGTSWSVGNQNLMMTNHHIVSDDDVEFGEVWFNSRADACGASDSAQNVVRIKAGKLITTGQGSDTDYTLFTLDQFDYKNAKIKTLFGGLRIQEKRSAVGETVYIPQHGSGSSVAKIAHTKDGEACKISVVGTKTYYNCDTQSGASGSPVLSQKSNEVVALHRAGSATANNGVSSWFLWEKIKSFMPAGSNVEVLGVGDVVTATVNLKAAPVLVKSVNGNASFETFDGDEMVHFGSAKNGYSTLAVEAKDVVSGNIVQVTYRLALKSACGLGNLAQACASTSAKNLHISYDDADNPNLETNAAITSWIPLKILSSPTATKEQALLMKIVHVHNTGPVAYLVGKKIAKANERVSLSGGASKNPEGKPLTYQWTVPAGIDATVNNSGLTFNAPVLAADTSFTFVIKVTAGTKSSKASHIVTVMKTDNAGEIKPPPLPPVSPPQAIVGGNINTVTTASYGFAYKLDGSKSLRAEKYAWEKLSGPFNLRNADQAIAEAIVGKNQTGESVYQLTVTGKDGKQHQANLKVAAVATSVTISGANAINQGAVVSLLAQANFSGAGGVAAVYSWKVRDMNGVIVLQETQQQLNLSGLAGGKYQATVEASSPHGGRQATAQHAVTVIKKLENKPPIALVAGPRSAEAGAAVMLNAAGSSATGGGTLRYDWKVSPQLPFNANGAKLTFTAPQSTQDTIYTFTVSVMEGNRTAEKTHLVLVHKVAENVCDIPQWEKKSYKGGIEVRVNGRRYISRWFTEPHHIPGSAGWIGAPWKDNGVCK